MKTTYLATHSDLSEEITEAQQASETIRVIRQGQWVILASEAEMTPSEKRQAYCNMFGIYGGW